MSITGGITDGSLFGGAGKQLDFTGGRVTGVVDTGTGVDSVVLGGNSDSLTLTGALTSTSLNAGGPQTHWLSRPICLPPLLRVALVQARSIYAGSISILATTIKGGAGADNVACTVQMMSFSMSHPLIPSLVELVQILCSSWFSNP